MYLRTLLNALVIDNKITIHTEDDHFMFAGTVKEAFGPKMAEIGHWRVKHAATCYNSKDGHYLSITLKNPR